MLGLILNPVHCSRMNCTANSLLSVITQLDKRTKVAGAERKTQRACEAFEGDAPITKCLCHCVIFRSEGSLSEREELE